MNFRLDLKAECTVLQRKSEEQEELVSDLRLRLHMVMKKAETFELLRNADIEVMKLMDKQVEFAFLVSIVCCWSLLSPKGVCTVSDNVFV